MKTPLKKSTQDQGIGHSRVVHPISYLGQLALGTVLNSHRPNQLTSALLVSGPALGGKGPNDSKFSLSFFITRPFPLLLYFLFSCTTLTFPRLVPSHSRSLFPNRSSVLVRGEKGFLYSILFSTFHLPPRPLVPFFHIHLYTCNKRARYDSGTWISKKGLLCFSLFP